MEIISKTRRVELHKTVVYKIKYLESGSCSFCSSPEDAQRIMKITSLNEVIGSGETEWDRARQIIHSFTTIAEIMKTDASKYITQV